MIIYCLKNYWVLKFALNTMINTRRGNSYVSCVVKNSWVNRTSVEFVYSIAVKNASRKEMLDIMQERSPFEI